MGWGIKLKAPKIKFKAPKVTVGKDLGLKNIASGASTLVKGAGDVASQVAKTTGKGIEGSIANTADIGKALAKGDFKGVGTQGLELLQSAKDMAKGYGSAGVSSLTNPLEAAGAATGSKDLQKSAQNIESEGKKGINTYGDAAIDVGANIATSGAYGLAKQSAQGLSSGGLGGLVSGKGLQDMALGAAGSYAGIDPNMLKMGMSAAQGDIKGAALQGLGSFAGLSPEQMKMASTGVSALTGDKQGLASGLASQFGAGDSAAGLIGNLAGGNMDFKKMALEKIGSLGGFSPEQIKMAEGALGGDFSKLASGLSSQFGAGDTASSMIGQFAGGKGAREIASDQAGAYAQDEANALLDQQFGNYAKNAPFDFSEQQKSAQNLQKDFQQIKTTADKARSAAQKMPESYEEWLYQMSGTGEYIGKERKEAMKKLYENRANMSADEFKKQVAAGGEKGFLDKTGDFFGGIGDTVSGAVGKVKDFAAENKDKLKLAAEAGAAKLGYDAKAEAMATQNELYKKQLEQEQAMGSELMGQQFDKNRYAQEQDFLRKRIEGQGRTALTTQMEQESMQKSAKMAAAARLAGMEQQARMGGAGLGTAGLAGAFAGAQAGQNVMAQDMRARDVQAEQDLERAIGRTGQLSTQQTKEEAELAQQKYGVESGRSTAAGATRSQVAQVAQNRADALGKLYTSGSDLVGKYLDTLEPSKTTQQTQQPSQQPPQQQTQQPPANQTGKPETYTLPPEIEAQAQAVGNSMQNRASGAYKIAQGDTLSAIARKQGMTVEQLLAANPQIKDPNKIQAGANLNLPAKDKFNQQNKTPVPAPAAAPKPATPSIQAPQPGQGQGYGVLAPAVQQGQQAVQKVQDTAQAAKDKYEQVKKDPLGAFGIKW